MSSATHLCSLASSIIIEPVQYYIQKAIRYLFTPRSTQLTIIIDERCGIARNQVYEAARIYLVTKISPDTKRFKVHKTSREKKLNTSIEKNEEIADTFQNVQLKWTFVSVESQNGKEKTYFELTFHKKFKEKVLNEYLPFVLAKYKEIKDNDKVMKLYARNLSDDSEDGDGDWGSINFEHPSTFETLAMDEEMKKDIIDDLERFVTGKEFYKRVGKPWKRGYLLYGPPGTGKSSLIAAMANYLNYNIYDLELTSVYSNSELRGILVSTTNRSIIVIEDIDCSAEISDRQLRNDPSETKLTLSGLLNFIDGLWSSCGDERIIVFTTNHKDRLDPALLRSGRMDMYIHMSYCTTQGFRLLASKYLGSCNPHRRLGEIEDLIENVQATPAEIVGQLMKSRNADIALGEVVNLLKRKKIEAHDIKEEICSGAEKEAKRMKSEKIADKTISNCRNVTTRAGSCRW